MKIARALTFDDILLVPQYSDIESIDKEIDTSTQVGKHRLDIPIISAAMDTVTGMKMLGTMLHLGGLGVHHRYVDNYGDLIFRSFDGPIAVSPSMGTAFIDSLNLTNPEATVALDVAHGDRKAVLNFAKYCRMKGLDVWSGNICTFYNSALSYLRIGVNTLKVGIGPGSACSTRVNTGCGYPQASAIWNIKQAAPGNVSIIADGGIKTSGDIVKALALGADAVILGGLLAGTEETPGAVYLDDETGQRYKHYRGMASEVALRQNNKTVRVEGVSGMVPYKGPVKDVIDSLMSGVKLGMAYVGARTIKELREKAEFVEITQAGQYEGMPRI